MRRALILAALSASAVTSSEADVVASSRRECASSAAPASPERLDRRLYFEPNLGQTSSEAQFLARGAGYVAFLTSDGVTIRTARAAARVRFVGGRRDVRGTASAPLPGRSNYFRGGLAVTDVAHFGAVAYDDVRPGIDVRFAADGRDLEFAVTAAPDADIADVRLQVEGADSVSTGAAGELIATLGGDTLTLSAPVAHEEVGGARRPVAARWSVTDGEASFRVDGRTPCATLVVDPTFGLSASTLLGGSLSDEANAVATDASGVYVVGGAFSTDFPTTTGAFRTSKGDSDTQGNYSDVFVTKFNPAGTALAYSTYLGGSSFEEGYAVAVDASGDAYVGGVTGSSNFPLQNAFRSTFSGSSGFLSELNAAGNGLIASTFMTAQIDKLGRDSSGNVAALATSAKTVFRFNSAITQQAYATVLNVSQWTLKCMAVEPSGAVWVGGQTAASPSIGATSGAYQTSFGGGNSDGLFLKLDAGGNRVYTSFLGGTGTDSVSDMAVDPSGALLFAGTTTSTGFATTGAYQTAVGGSLDGFVLKLDFPAQWDPKLGIHVT